MVNTAPSLSKGGEGWERVCPGLLVAPLSVGSSCDMYGCRKSGDAAGRGSEHRQGCRQRNCCRCQQLQVFKYCELRLGVLGFGVCECTAAAANGSPLFWEGQLRFSCTLAPGEGLRSTLPSHCELSGWMCWVSVSNSAVMAPFFSLSGIRCSCEYCSFSALLLGEASSSSGPDGKGVAVPF